jgi:glucan 1,3-beta-glucosidase
LAGVVQPPRPPAWLRFGWLFVLAFYGLLLVFDGRYRDLPLGLFELPCLGYALVHGLSGRQEVRMPALEERFLAAWLPVLAAIVVWQEAGLTPVAWLWLGLNLSLALPVLFGWRHARQHLRLHPQQA